MTRRKSFFDEIEEVFKRFKRLLEEHDETCGLESFGHSSLSMYSITVTYDHYGNPVVRVSAQGNIDRREVERYLRERYPNAKIVWESDKPRIKHVEENHVKEASAQDHSDLKLTRRARGAEVVEVDSKKARIHEVKIEDEGENKKDRRWYDVKVD